MLQVLAVIHYNLFQQIFGTSLLSFFINLVFIIIVGIIVLPVIYNYLILPISSLILDIPEFKRLAEQDKVFLELTPSLSSLKSTTATAELFKVIYGFSVISSTKDKLLRHKNILSFEVVSTRSDGIRFIVCLPRKKLSSLTQQLVSYFPDIKFKQIKDYLPKDINPDEVSLLEFKQLGYFAYPLADKSELSIHDPLSYIVGSMTKLKSDELISFQIVMSPASKRVAINAREKLISDGVTKKRSILSLPARFIYKVVKVSLKILFGTIYAILSMFGGGPRYSLYQRRFNQNKLNPLTDEDKRIIKTIHAKLNQPLFYVDIRGLIKLKDEVSITERKEGLIASLSSFNELGYQEIGVRKSLLPSLSNKYSLYKYRHRLPSIINYLSGILSVSELSSIYHFPYGDRNKTENLVRSLSKTLPATISAKQNEDSGSFDVILGKNYHHGSETSIGLTKEERQRHVYIIGGTGNGKTTMMLYSIIQDIKAGKGLAVIDPHGDLAKTILEHIPEDRIKDVIYFDPDDVDYPIAVNLLELPEGLAGSELDKEKDRITESVISVFRKIFSKDDSGGHRIEYVLRNSIQTALMFPNPTIFTVFELLTNTDYRKRIISQLPNGTLKNFWKNELGSAGNMQRVKMSAGITAKIGRFEFSTSAKRVMDNPKSSIDFDDILNSNKILICNFSKGRLGEDTSALFGTTILAKLQIAVNRRDKIDESERIPFYLYVDEFQNFATTSFVQMLSEARKYKLYLTMAEQSTSQQEEQRMVNIILANVGTVVVFRTGSPLDEQLILPLFKPFLEEGEITNLPSFNFYIRITAIEPQEPMSGKTLLLEDDGNKKAVERVKTNSRKNYTVKFIDKEKKS